MRPIATNREQTAAAVIVIICALLWLAMTGCLNSPVALRSNMTYTVQEVSTDATANSTPATRDETVNAEKTTNDSYKADIPAQK